LIDHLPFGDREFGRGRDCSPNQLINMAVGRKRLRSFTGKEMTSDARLDNQVARSLTELTE